jgi:hypothetical protein
VDANTQIAVGTIKDVQVKVDVPACPPMGAMLPGKEKIKEGGGSKSKEFDLPVLDLANPNQYKPGMYQIKVTLGQLATETGAHTALSAPFDYEYQFGTVLAGKTKIKEKMTVKGPAGTATFGMAKGPGLGTFTLAGASADLAFTGTDATSDALATGSVGLRGVTAASAMDSVVFPGVDVAGNSQFSGGLEGGLTFHILGGGSGSDLQIAAGDGQPSDLFFTGVKNAAIEADAGVGTLLTGEWLASSGDTNRVTAPFLKHLGTSMKDGKSGNFEADLNLTGTVPDGTFSLVKADIAGHIGTASDISPSTWNVAGNVKDLFAGSFDGFKFNGKDVFAIKTAAVRSSQITASGDIGAFIMVPVKPFVDPPAPAFTHSSINAGRIGLALVRDVDATLASTITAGKILSYERLAGKSVMKQADGGLPQGPIDQDGDFLVNVTVGGP